MMIKIFRFASTDKGQEIFYTVNALSILLEILNIHFLDRSVGIGGPINWAARYPDLRKLDGFALG